MKKIALLSSLIIPLLVVVGFIATDKTKSNGESVSFYETPLVCNAAPEIGCGSRAKPALLALEKNPAVKEAWLNRAGTIIAIVWKNKVQTATVARPILDENKIAFTELSSNEAAIYKKEFRKSNAWFRGSEVDVLSREEATTIAENTVKFALETNLITKAEAEKIKKEVEAYFKEELVKIRTQAQLSEDSEHKFMEAMYSIGEKHIGKERTQKALELYKKGCEQQCRKDGACEHPGSKKSCCEKQ
jgi:hypothetical protein